jgi:uncharacterized protein YfiM (DUF2279 family)
MSGVITASVVVAGATIYGASKASEAAGKAAGAPQESAKDANAVQLQISQDQLAAQKEALDKQIAASGATADKQLLAQRDALERQIAIQEQMYVQSRADFAPYREAGTANLNQLQTLLGLGGNTGAADFGRFKTADFTPEMFAAGVDPGYAFRLSEGLKGIDRQAAARGGLISGNALKAASGFAGDQASQEYTNAFNRFQTIRGNTLSPFQTGAAAGQSAAAMQGQANANYGTANSQAYGAAGQGATGVYGAAGGANNAAYANYGQGTTGVLGAYGTNVSNNLIGAGNAAASGYVGSANAVNSGISGVANTYYQNQMMNMFRDKSTQQGLVNQYGANNLYGAGQANYQPNMPTNGFRE